MPRSLNGDSIAASLAANGWNEQALARSIGVSGRVVSSWLAGREFPAPPLLLKLATTLALAYDDLVVSRPDDGDPVVSFRSLTGGSSVDEATDCGRTQAALLARLVPCLPMGHEVRTQIASPCLSYDRLQSTVRSVRERIGLGEQARLSFDQLTGEFGANAAVIVPVMWGGSSSALAALRIQFPRDQVSFVYLNLDADVPSFTFNIAQELALVYACGFVGGVEGQRYANAFAGALLFPSALASCAYSDASAKSTTRQRMAVLDDYAARHCIPLAVVIAEVERHASATNLPSLMNPAEQHPVRSSEAGVQSVARRLFGPQPPSASTLIAAARDVFKSPAFPALARLIHESGTGPGFVQQLLNCAMADADALHRELRR